MGLAFTAITLSGPIVGFLGLYLGSSILIWIGIALATFNLFMNLASGAMRFPLLALAAVLLGSAMAPPWHYGAGLGLLSWTALEGAGELLPTNLWRGRRYVPYITGCVVLAVAGYLLLSIGGLWAVLGASFLAAFGVASIKTALFATDHEVDELTDPDLSRKLSEDTAKKFVDRI